MIDKNTSIYLQSLPNVLEHLHYFCCSISSIPLSPQNNVVKLSVDGYRKVAMLADPSLTNKYLIHHCFGGEGIQLFEMDKKIIFISNHALINWCSKDFWQRL